MSVGGAARITSAEQMELLVKTAETKTFSAKIEHAWNWRFANPAIRSPADGAEPAIATSPGFGENVWTKGNVNPEGSWCSEIAATVEKWNPAAPSSAHGEKALVLMKDPVPSGKAEKPDHADGAARLPNHVPLVAIGVRSSVSMRANARPTAWKPVGRAEIAELCKGFAETIVAGDHGTAPVKACAPRTLHNKRVAATAAQEPVHAPQIAPGEAGVPAPVKACAHRALHNKRVAATAAREPVHAPQIAPGEAGVPVPVKAFAHRALHRRRVAATAAQEPAHAP